MIFKTKDFLFGNLLSSKVKSES